MHFMTIPLHVTPRPEDAERLRAKQEAFRVAVEEIAFTKAAWRAGRASDAMMHKAADNKHLLRVLER